MIQFDRFSKFSYKHVHQSDSVVIVGGGPSTGIYAEEVKQYIKDNDSTVLAANYSYEGLGIESDYTFTIDRRKIVQNIEHLNSHLIVSAKFWEKTNTDKKKKFSKLREPINDAFYRHVERGYKVYKVGRPKGPHLFLSKKVSFLEIDKNGKFPYSTIGISGTSLIPASLVCRPKKMLIVGIDGPVGGGKTKLMFDGREVNYGKDVKCEKIKQSLLNIVLPGVLDRKITMETFKDVGIYGFNKKKVGIKVIG